MSFREEITQRRLDKVLADNQKLVQQIRMFDSLVRAACTELNVCYCGVDNMSGEVVSAIKQLKTQEGCLLYI